MMEWPTGQLGSLTKREMTPIQWPFVGSSDVDRGRQRALKTSYHGQKTLSRGFHEPCIIALHILDELQHMGYPQSRTSVNKLLSLTVLDVWPRKRRRAVRSHTKRGQGRSWRLRALVYILAILYQPVGGQELSEEAMGDARRVSNP